jgi:hypothetical protein
VDQRGGHGNVEGAAALKLEGVIRTRERAMSWEYSRYYARCDKCGNEGVCIRGSDDWGRTSTSWVGFGSKEPHPYELGRKRASSRDLVPACICGSTSITVGKPLGHT